MVTPHGWLVNTVGGIPSIITVQITVLGNTGTPNFGKVGNTGNYEILIIIIIIIVFIFRG